MKKNITLILLLIASTTYSQSAWNKKKGSGFFKLSQSFIVSDQFFDNSKEVVDITTTGVYITSIYGEYGLSDKFTAFAYVPIFFRNTLNEIEFSISNTTQAGDELNSVGDTNIGLAYAIKQDSKFVLNASFMLGLPVGNDSGGDTGLLQSGDGEFNQLIRANWGYSFYPAPFYATGSVGFNNRTNDFSDEFHWGIEFGATIKEDFNLAFKVYNITSFENGDALASQNGIFANNTEFLSFGPELSYTHNDKFGLSATIQGAASGRNILAAPNYSFGIHYQF